MRGIRRNRVNRCLRNTFHAAVRLAQGPPGALSSAFPSWRKSPNPWYCQLAGADFRQQTKPKIAPNLPIFEGLMSIKIRSKELSSAEASFLKWQYGFDEEDEPFERALWQAIMRAWEADYDSKSNHLERLGSTDAYPEEVALYVNSSRRAATPFGMN